MSTDIEVDSFVEDGKQQIILTMKTLNQIKSGFNAQAGHAAYLKTIFLLIATTVEILSTMSSLL